MADNHHQHHHDHDESAQDGSSWAQRNKAHWDKAAATYQSGGDGKKWSTLLNQLTTFLLQNVNWIGVPFLDPSSSFESQSSSLNNHSVRVLDYACGPGTITAALAGYATEYVGIDISDNMVSEFNKRFESPPTIEGRPDHPQKLNAFAVVGDLLDSSGTPSHLDDPKYFNFDLAVVSGGFHHFENVELATRRLTNRLKPGGVFMIFDFLPHEAHDMKGDAALHTVAHHGFGEAKVKELFAGAGLVDVDIKVMDDKIQLRENAWRKGFLAKGRKPEA